MPDPRKHWGRLRSAGFTLVEMMVALGIAAILAGMAMPSFSTMIANQRVKSAASDIHTSLLKARGEALKRNVSVTLAPSTANDWTAGWSIANPTAGSPSIEQHGATKGLTISGPGQVVYRSSGRVDATSAPAFDISASNATQHRCITVDLSGRPYVKKTSC